MPSIVLSVLYVVPSLIFTKPFEICTIISHILQMRKWRYREIKWLSQDNLASDSTWIWTQVSLCFSYELEAILNLLVSCLHNELLGMGIVHITMWLLHSTSFYSSYLFDTFFRMNEASWWQKARECEVIWSCCTYTGETVPNLMTDYSQTRSLI